MEIEQKPFEDLSDGLKQLERDCLILTEKSFMSQDDELFLLALVMKLEDVYTVLDVYLESTDNA